MLKYILKRLGLMLLVLFLVMTLCFFVLRLMPGSPFTDLDASPEVQQMMEEKYHLNEPVLAQYYYYLREIFAEGNWGVSLKREPMVPVWQVLASRIPVTAALNFLTLLVSLPLGFLAGLLCAVKKNELPDRLVSLLVVLGIALPSFVAASLLQYFLGYQGPFPIIYASSGSFGERLCSLILPVFALSLYPVATICRYLRGELIETMGTEYMQLARCKGLTRRSALLRHGLRNAMVPMMQVIVPLFTNIVTGSLVVERLFAVPGVGGLLTESIQAGDYWLTMTALIFYTMVNLAAILLTDISYGLIDPRIRLGRKTA